MQTKTHGVAALLLLASVGFASPLTAQTSANESNVREETSQPSRSLRDWADEQAERYNRIASEMERYGISPLIGTLGQGSGLAFGAHYQRDVAGPADVEGSAGFSIRGYRLYEFRMGEVSERRYRTTLRPTDTHVASQFDAARDRIPGHGVYAEIRYRHSPLDRYYGAGPDASLDDRTAFLVQGASYDVVAEFQPRKWFGFAARGGLLDFTIGSGGDSTHPSTEVLFTDLSAPGLLEQPVFLHVSGAVALDGRDSAAAPRSGGMAGLMVSHFDGLGGSEFDFWRIASDVRYFLPTFERGVVALRALGSTDRVDSHSRVPFYLQQTLGGGDTLRGFNRARFRDTSLVLMSGEYRWDVHPAFELAALFDIGQVAPSFSALSREQFSSSWGAGVRWKSKSRRTVKFRVDWAFSREGQRLVLSGSPSF